MRIALALLLLGGVALAQAQATPAGGSWMRYAQTDKMDDSVNVMFRVKATGSGEKGRTPSFNFICTNGRLAGITYDADIRLAVDEADDGSAKTIVRYRVDQNAPERAEWRQTRDGQMLVSMRAPIQPLAPGQTLMIRASTLGGDIITDEFPIADLDADMFHQDCGR